jgi:hypothetical protein
MKLHGSIALFVFVALAVLAHGVDNAHAFDRESERAVKAFLSSQETDREGADSQGFAVADLNGDGKSEIILVWTSLGPTYWQNNLTILSRAGKGYKPVASLALIGEARLSSVEKGIIRLDQTIYGKDDPKCCPSVKKQAKYRWTGRKIGEVKE